MRTVFGALGLVSLGVAVAAGCGSTPVKIKPRAAGGEGGGAGEPPAISGGEGGAVPTPIGGEAGAAPLGGQAGATEMPSTTPTPTGTGLSLPAALKFGIPCGAARAQATLSLTNWSDQAIELTTAMLEGAFKLETQLPLTIGSGESGEIVVSTAPGVVGTDAPGDQRTGKLALTSNLGTAVVQLDGAIDGAKLVIDSIPGAALTGPLAFTCSSASSVGLCPSQTFTIVNNGTSNAVLQPPFGDQHAVAAFVPGSAQPLTLVPGAAVKVEVRAAANGNADKSTADTLFIPVDGSCEKAQLEVPLAIDGPDNCVCPSAPPGIEAAPFAGTHACGTEAPADVTVFNGSTTALEVLGAYQDSLSDTSLPAVTTFPFSVASGKSAVLQLLTPKYPGYPGNQPFQLILATSRGEVHADANWQATGGSAILLFNALGTSVPATLALNGCAPVELAVENYASNGPMTVSPPVASGGVSVSGFSAPQLIQAGEKFVFSVAAVSNAGNGCATAGGLAFAVDGDCRGPTLNQAVSFTGTCTCDGI